MSTPPDWFRREMEKAEKNHSDNLERLNRRKWLMTLALIIALALFIFIPFIAVALRKLLTAE